MPTVVAPVLRIVNRVRAMLPGEIWLGDVVPVIVIPPEVVPNVAVTLRSALIATEHAPVPVHAPDQPVNVEPDAGVAVRATVLAELKSAPQVDGQLMPDGELVTVPDPAPDVVTVRWCVVGGVPVTVTAPSGPEGAIVKPSVFSADAELVKVPGAAPTFAVNLRVPSPLAGTTSGPAQVRVFPLPIVGLLVVNPVVEPAT
jgi:hypothetical protein